MFKKSELKNVIQQEHNWILPIVASQLNFDSKKNNNSNQ